VAQIYAYMYPERLHRLVLIGVNPPGHFVDDPAVYDRLLEYIGGLCAQDESCSQRTADFAQTMYAVNHNMPRRWLFFNVDGDTLRLGSHFMFMSSQNMAQVFDAYLAAAEGDPAGLAMANLFMSQVPIDEILIYGDSLSKGVSADRERYQGLESISLGDSVMGAPASEMIWPLAVEWPVEMIPPELREFQESDVEMLLINGTIDFATPPGALDEARPFYHRAQMVLLLEFSHTADVMTLQPEAFERLVTSFYESGVADDSLYVYQPLSFEPATPLGVMIRRLVAAMVVVPALIVLGVLLVARRARRRAFKQ
jgi:pimeloyl-ACP methyl ester carboxylesterase